MRARLTAYALIVAGVIGVVAFVVSWAAVFIGALCWIWTGEVTALRVVGTGIVVGGFVMFMSGRIEGPPG